MLTRKDERNLKRDKESRKREAGDRKRTLKANDKERIKNSKGGGRDANR